MNRFLTGIPFCLTAILSFAADIPDHAPEDLLMLESSEAKIGIDRAKGASITWLSWNGYPNNTVNLYDPGRLIQQSYYAGKRLDRRADGQTPSWSPWSWNPIQGGGTGSWARVTRFEHRKDRGLLFGETIPKLWDMPDEEAQAIMRQWTRFEKDMPRVVVVKNQLVCKREPTDRWGPAHPSPQELPACYFTRNFDTFKSYQGEQRWNTLSQKAGPPWGRTKPPLKAMACFNKEGQGIAIYSPASGETWNFGPHVNAPSKDPKGGPCVHIAPVGRVRLGPRSTYEYRYWLIVGTQAQITSDLDRLIQSYSTERGKLTEPGAKSAD